LPYLAQRAEEQYGVRELAREIKAQYAVINRIAEEMQDAIMQVRMMPVSFVFQRFPRLVRDLSRKLGKEVQLVLEGEETEADKNIIESLSDPLIHIVRNSLDHGFEIPAERRAAGKPTSGKLTIRAMQEGDQVLIEIIDDGKGISPAVVKRKAYEKGVIDEATLEHINDRDAVNLVFAAGFSTAEVVSDLSGRGVGMDVVRTAVEKVNGTIQLESEVGRGTRIRISLPLSMAVTQVIIVESDRQIFGVPMDHVVETVRIPCSAIRTIKHSKTVVLRGSIVPLKALNGLLGLPASPQANAYDEMAVLVAKVGGEVVGLIVDDFHETVDVIQKPLNGMLSGLTAYSGSALMGDGSVLMVLNVKEIV
jgi:two-component system chemotaxis sensor kinase CheA